VNQNARAHKCIRAQSLEHVVYLICCLLCARRQGNTPVPSGSRSHNDQHGCTISFHQESQRRHQSARPCGCCQSTSSLSSSSELRCNRVHITVGHYHPHNSLQNIPCIAPNFQQIRPLFQPLKFSRALPSICCAVQCSAQR
jgi:hypothetical protein